MVEGKYVEGKYVGTVIAYGDGQDSSGERKVYAVAVLPDKLKVTATASNYTEHERRKAAISVGGTVFAKDELGLIITRTGFRVG